MEKNELTQLVVTLEATNSVPDSEVIAALTSMGLKIESHMQLLGVVVGEAPREIISALTQLPGVDSVRVEERFEAPGPDEGEPQ